MDQLLRIPPFLLAIVIIIACSADLSQQKVIPDPVIPGQSFISASRSLGEISRAENSFMQKLKQLITGTEGVPALTRPTGIVIETSGDVYVVDADKAQILHYHYEENSLTSITAFGNENLISPWGIEIIAGVIYVSDLGSGEIVRFDRNYKFLGALVVDGLVRPGQLKFNAASGRLLIVDTPGHQVLAVDTLGSVQASIGNDSRGKPLLKNPVAVDITPDGRLVILDGLSRRVEFFSPTYQYLDGFGKYDQVPGSFAYPRGLAISSDGLIFISDTAFGNIQIFDQTGILLYYWGQTGVAAGEFMLPVTLVFDNQDNLYVADQYNSRVQIFSYVAQDG